MRYTYKFKIDALMFRKALYFNAFSKQRGQIVFVSVAWVGAIVLACMNIFGRLELTNVVQTCYLVVLLSVPLLIFSCERGYRQYRGTDLPEKLRTVSMCDDWIKFRISGDVDSDKVEWHNISAAFELEDIFIIYRDANQMVVLPKDSMNEDELPKIRCLLSYKLGRSFKQRCRFGIKKLQSA